MTGKEIEKDALACRIAYDRPMCRSLIQVSRVCIAISSPAGLGTAVIRWDADCLEPESRLPEGRTWHGEMSV